MAAVLAFSALLLLAVLVSDLSHRSVLSTAVVFLVGGFVLGDGVLGVIEADPQGDVVATFAELALFTVLFTDGMKVGVRELRSAWRLPGRALLIGLPLTMLVTALFARFIVGLPWAEAFLVGAALSPTDPVFAAAIVGREEIPYRLRRLLNVESGLNDGLALPVVLVLLAIVNEDSVSGGSLIWEVVLGVALGIVVPWVAIRLLSTRFFSSSAAYEPLNAVAIGLVVFSLASLTHANEFLAAFAAGVTVASTSEPVKAAFHRFGDLVAELLKLAAIMLFGALISPTFLGEIPPSGYAFAVLAVFAARPIAIALSFLGSHLPRREWAAAAWFGPKGFASVVYGLLIVRIGTAAGDEIFHLIAIVVVLSIFLHSSTDVPVAHWFERAQAADRAPGPTVPES